MSKLYLGSSLINTTYMGSSFNGKLQMQQELDAWEKVIFACKYGNYTELYPIGYTQELDLGSEGIVNMQVVAHNADELADGSGYAPLTWISKELLNTNYHINASNSSNTEGTGAIGGWPKTAMYKYINTTIKALLPENLKTSIRTVNKSYRGYDTSGNMYLDVSADACWIPSYREIYGTSNNETSGPMYTQIFSDNTSRIKYHIGSTNKVLWWLRSANGTNYFRYVDMDGSSSYSIPHFANGVVLGFCT